MQAEYVKLELADGIASLRFAFPGAYFGLRELNALLQVAESVRHNPFVEVLLLQSDHPSGFCQGVPFGTHDFAEDRLYFSKLGQKLLSQFTTLPIPTIAHIHGACFGPGWELALACDYRIATTGPKAWLGWHKLIPAWGGGHWASRLSSKRTVKRLLSGERLTAKEAFWEGLIDDAFTERRAKVEQCHWMNRLRKSGHKRTSPVSLVYLAQEREQFRHWQPPEHQRYVEPRIGNPFQRVLIVGGNPEAAALVVECCLQGLLITTIGVAESALHEQFQYSLKRGRVTPLELEQAEKRLQQFSETAELVCFTDDRLPHFQEASKFIGSRTIISVPPAGLPPLSRLDARLDRQIGVSWSWADYHVELIPWQETSPASREKVLGFLSELGYSVHEDLGPNKPTKPESIVSWVWPAITVQNETIPVPRVSE